MTPRLTLLCFCLSLTAAAQQTFPVNGVHDPRDLFHAFTNATIITAPGKQHEGATLLLKSGKIEQVGVGVTLPPGTVVHDCKGKYIYASFIDLYSGIAGVISPARGQRNREPVAVSESNAGNWNPSVHPEFKFDPPLPLDQKISEDWLASGFGVVNVHKRDGIMRGNAQLLVLGPEKPNEALIQQNASQHFSFHKGTSAEPYPSSLMGALPLVRQTLYDARWYNNLIDLRPEENPSLAALKDIDKAVNIFELNHALSARNATDIGREFGIPIILKGTGMEYLVQEDLHKEIPVIVPLIFPKAHDVRDPYLAQMVTLREMKHWEAAPYNARYLQQRGITICLSRDTLKTHDQFIANLQRAIRCGLSHDAALEALTTTPARLIRSEKLIGKLEAGMFANFIITNKKFDEEGFLVQEHWTRGQPTYTAPPQWDQLAGTYHFVIEGRNIEVVVEKPGKSPISAKAKDTDNGTELKAVIEPQGELVSVTLSSKDTMPVRLYSLSGKISLSGTVWDGRGQDTTGRWITWGAVKARPKNGQTAKTEDKPRATPSSPSILRPNMAFGYDTLSVPKSYVVTNARVWTCGAKGILEGADILVSDGKIKSISTNALYPADLRRIDAGGRHVTPGLIDEHSHIGIRGGVNEWAQASSAEVRIADVIDPWNINIYRQLAGGVTTAQLLHGSANPIGGQSAIVKLKWGESAGKMIIPDAPGFIKFALGENVKRSTSQNNTRFPNTRMGVEQSIADVFIRAREYEQTSAQTGTGKGKKGGRKSDMPTDSRTDLELTCIAEILRGERHITCHSYVQSEILMLMALADSLGFKVNTFTHILEGYKVAAEMRTHGVCASTFSDWWAYKFEVNDAIPYNAALLTRSGIITAINSDDAEMGRRLNQEAAKSMKYGGLSEEEALNLVTINPARMLHIEHRTGSLEPGKDADFVIWSDHPLSVHARPDKTFIEGQLYFDRSADERLKKEIARERARLISAMIGSKEEGKKTPRPTHNRHYHCDTIVEDYCSEE